ncbi:MAG TPA: tetratricopeptide repeat protein, partial [Candidatus Sumerlaeota bacterium]|nr:tetratricopeptide repeat protein [Candidatus Sumerlaeota bacterium]
MMIRKVYKEKKIQRLIWYGLILGFASILVYAPSLRGGFINEDAENILNNPAFHAIKNIPSLFQKPHPSAQHWQPLTSLSFMIDYRLWEAKPIGYRLTNLVLHIVCSLICFIALERLTQAGNIAFFASLLFALHPLHTENVARISGRAEIIGGIFLFAALVSHLAADVKTKGIPLFLFNIFVPVLFILGLLSHEGLIILPFILMFGDLVWKREESKSNFFKIYTPLFLIAAIYLVLRIIIFRISFNIPNYIVRIMAQLLYLSLFPLRLTVFYPVKTLPAMGISLFVGCAVLAALIILRKKRLFFYGLGLFILALTGVLFMSPDFQMIEGKAYYATIGMTLFISAALMHLEKSGERHATSPNRIAAAIIGLSLLGFYSVTTYIRSEKFSDDFSLWNAESKIHPDSALILNNLGRAYYGKSGMSAMAEKSFRQAIASEPKYTPSYLNLARLLIDANRIKEAEKILEHAAISGGSIDDENYVVLAMLYQEIGNDELAEKMYAKSVEIHPGNSVALSELGRIAFERGEYEKSIEYMTESLKGKQTTLRAQVFSNRASAYYRLGKIEESLADAQAAMAENPQLANPYLLIAEIEAKRKFAEKSVAVLEESLQKVPNPPFEIYLALHKLYIDFKQVQKAFDILYEYQNRVPNDIRG